MPIVHQQPKVPKYWKLAETLRAQITSGELLPGAQMPTVAQLQAQYGVSLSTVNQAQSLLEKDGLIVREQGRRTFVAERPAVQTVGTLGLLLHVEPLSGAYTTELLAGIRSEARQQNLELLWLNDEDVSNCRKADAILMYCHPTEAYMLNPPANVPNVLLFQHTPDFNCVSVDDFTGIQIATRHLLEHGHRRIAYLVSSDIDTISRQRVAGYRAALAEAGIQPDERWLRFIARSGINNYRRNGEEVMQKWLESDWQELGCTAILAQNDETAIGIIKALRDRGISVPAQVSVVGFDGTEVSELSTPQLTTIKVPLRELGASAVRLLTQQISQGKVFESQKILMPVQLKNGDSVVTLK
jgi:GntR family transcriptional regulator of arabinose operon